MHKPNKKVIIMFLASFTLPAKPIPSEDIKLFEKEKQTNTGTINTPIPPHLGPSAKGAGGILPLVLTTLTPPPVVEPIFTTTTRRPFIESTIKPEPSPVDKDKGPPVDDKGPPVDNKGPPGESIIEEGGGPPPGSEEPVVPGEGPPGTKDKGPPGSKRGIRKDWKPLILFDEQDELDSEYAEQQRMKNFHRGGRRRHYRNDIKSFS